MDVFSIYCILISLTGKPAFIGKSHQEIISNNKNAQINFENKNWVNVSASAKDLCKKLLAKNHKERIDVEMALNHFWFQTEFPIANSNLLGFAAFHEHQFNEQNNVHNDNTREKNNQNIKAPSPLKQFKEFYPDEKAITPITGSRFNIISRLSKSKNIWQINFSESLKPISKNKFSIQFKPNEHIKGNLDSNLNSQLQKQINNDCKGDERHLKIQRRSWQNSRGIYYNSCSLAERKEYQLDGNILFKKEKSYEKPSNFETIQFNEFLIYCSNSKKELASQNSNINEIKEQKDESEISISKFESKFHIIPEALSIYKQNMIHSEYAFTQNMKICSKFYD